MIAQSALEEIGMKFGFFEYGLVGLPILIVGIIYFAVVGYKLLPNSKGGADSVFDEQIDYSNVPQWKQVLSLVILIATIIGMIFEERIGIPLYVTSGIGAILLVLTGVMTEKQAYKSITLALAAALEGTGAGAIIADTVINLLGENASPFALLFAVLLISSVLTNFMSNTATTALLVPISLSIATGMGADPRAVLMATVIGGSMAYVTPIGMPANTMVLAPGGYKFRDYTKAGLPLMVVAFVLSLILLPIFFPFFPGT